MRQGIVIAAAVRAVMTMRTELTGTASDLLVPRPGRVALGRWQAG
jgi:hypothetical protein